MSEAHYHQAAHTLDPNVEIPDDAPMSAGHWPEEADAVKAASDAHRDQSADEVEAEAAKAQEFDERDPKPTPSEFAAESGREPSAKDEDDDKDDDKAEKPKKQGKKKDD